MSPASRKRTFTWPSTGIALSLALGIFWTSVQSHAAVEKIEPTCKEIQKIIESNPREAEDLMKEGRHPKWCFYYLALEYEKKNNLKAAQEKIKTAHNFVSQNTPNLFIKILEKKLLLYASPEKFSEDLKLLELRAPDVARNVKQGKKLEISKKIGTFIYNPIRIDCPEKSVESPWLDIILKGTSGALRQLCNLHKSFKAFKTDPQNKNQATKKRGHLKKIKNYRKNLKTYQRKASKVHPFQKDYNNQKSKLDAWVFYHSTADNLKNQKGVQAKVNAGKNALKKLKSIGIKKDPRGLKSQIAALTPVVTAQKILRLLKNENKIPDKGMVNKLLKSKYLRKPRSEYAALKYIGDYYKCQTSSLGLDPKDPCLGFSNPGKDTGAYQKKLKLLLSHVYNKIKKDIQGELENEHIPNFVISLLLNDYKKWAEPLLKGNHVFDDLNSCFEWISPLNISPHGTVPPPPEYSSDAAMKRMKESTLKKGADNFRFCFDDEHKIGNKIFKSYFNWVISGVCALISTRLSASITNPAIEHERNRLKQVLNNLLHNDYFGNKAARDARIYVIRQRNLLLKYKQNKDYSMYGNKAEDLFTCSIEKTLNEKIGDLPPAPEKPVSGPAVQKPARNEWKIFLDAGRRELQRFENPDHPSLFIWNAPDKNDNQLLRKIATLDLFTAYPNYLNYLKQQKTSGKYRRAVLKSFLYQQFGDRVILFLLRQDKFREEDNEKFCNKLIRNLKSLEKLYKSEKKKIKDGWCGHVFFEISKNVFNKLINDEYHSALVQWDERLSFQQDFAKAVISAREGKSSGFFSPRKWVPLEINWDDHINNLERLAAHESIFFYFARKMYNNKKKLKPADTEGWIVKSLKEYIQALQEAGPGATSPESLKQILLRKLDSSFREKNLPPHPNLESLKNEAEFVMDYFESKHSKKLMIKSPTLKGIPTAMSFLFHYAETEFPKPLASKKTPINKIGGNAL